MLFNGIYVYIMIYVYEIEIIDFIESINFCSWFLILICCKKLKISVYDKKVFFFFRK